MLAAVLIAAGLFLLTNAFDIQPPRGFSVVDPNVFPIFVSLGILGLGIIMLLRTTLVPDWDLAHTTSEEGLATHWVTVWLVGGTLVIYAFALNPAGYIIATTIFFPVCARWMGSTRPLRDIAVGLVVSVVVFLFFTEVLGIRLPAGPLEPLFDEIF